MTSRAMGCAPCDTSYIGGSGGISERGAIRALLRQWCALLTPLCGGGGCKRREVMRALYERWSAALPSPLEVVAAVGHVRSAPWPTLSPRGSCAL